jgi:hypothetical protein
MGRGRHATAPDEATPPGRSQGAKTRLLRLATPLRVTAPSRRGDERQGCFAARGRAGAPAKHHRNRCANRPKSGQQQALFGSLPLDPTEENARLLENGIAAYEFRRRRAGSRRKGILDRVHFFPFIPQGEYSDNSPINADLGARVRTGSRTFLSHRGDGRDHASAKQFANLFYHRLAVEPRYERLATALRRRDRCGERLQDVD